MKAFKIVITGVVLIMSSLISFDSFGQRKHGPPHWAPAHGYNAETRYVYFPQHNFYYDMHRRVYIFSDGPEWHMAPALPSVYAWINLGNSMQVALDFYGERPYVENHYHCEQYSYKDHHKAWKKQHKEWEKREKEWAKEYKKRHRKCGSSCGDYRYADERRYDDRPTSRPNGRVRVDVRF